MQDFRKRRSLRGEVIRISRGVAVVVVLAVVAFFAVRAVWGMYGKFAAASEARTQAETQLAEVETEYTQVKAQVADLSTSRGVEAQVRQRYGVALPGEGEIDIVRQSPTTTAASSAGQGWWAKLWSLFPW